MTKRPYKITRNETKFGLDHFINVRFDDGRMFYLSVTRGRRVRIMYKPRGQNWGYHWFGSVRDSNAESVWSGQVNKSIGALGLLKAAGLVESEVA